MQQQMIFLVISVLLAIPVGIAANRLTERYSRYMAKRSAEAAERQLSRSRTTRERAEWFAHNTDALNAFVGGSILRGILWASFALMCTLLGLGIAGESLFLAEKNGPVFLRVAGSATATLAILFALAAFFVLMRIVTDARQLIANVSSVRSWRTSEYTSGLGRDREFETHGPSSVDGTRAAI